MVTRTSTNSGIPGTREAQVTRVVREAAAVRAAAQAAWAAPVVEARVDPVAAPAIPAAADPAESPMKKERVHRRMHPFFFLVRFSAPSGGTFSENGAQLLEATGEIRELLPVHPLERSEKQLL